MDDKKRYAGSKVSEIANRFQEKLPPQREQVISVKTKQKIVHESVEDQATVTVMRTESHVTRFNNARAMFEKLGEETKTPRDKVITVHATKSTTSTDYKYSSNLASTTKYDYFSSGSRSPSPDQIRNIQLCHNSIPKNIRVHADNIIKREEKSFKINGMEKNRLSGGEANFVEIFENPGKSEKPKKPEKPERKFSSKELIEKQRNWTSHFAKTRSSRYNSDPNKIDIKFVENCNNEKFDNKQCGGRSASFNVKPTTSLITTGETSDNFKRLNSNKKERPASVIPTLNDFIKSDQTMVTITAKPLQTTQIAVRKNKANSFVEDSTEHVSELSDFKTQNSCDITSDFCLKSDLVCPAVEDNRDSLSATSESQSSLSPLSSPGNLKSELEKQEDEGNEKSSSCKFIFIT